MDEKVKEFAKKLDEYCSLVGDIVMGKKTESDLQNSFIEFSGFIRDIYTAGEKSGAGKIMKKIQGRIRDEKHLRGLTFDRALEIIEEAARSISGEEKV